MLSRTEMGFLGTEAWDGETLRSGASRISRPHRVVIIWLWTFKWVWTSYCYISKVQGRPSNFHVLASQWNSWHLKVPFGLDTKLRCPLPVDKSPHAKTNKLFQVCVAHTQQTQFCTSLFSFPKKKFGPFWSFCHVSFHWCSALTWRRIVLHQFQGTLVWENHPPKGRVIFSGYGLSKSYLGYTIRGLQA